MKDTRQKIIEIITHTHKMPFEQADEILRLFSSQREQLIAFMMHIDTCYGMHVRADAEKCVDDYLKNN